MKTPDGIIFEFGNVPKSDTAVVGYWDICVLLWEAQRDALEAAADEVCDGCETLLPAHEIRGGGWVHINELADPSFEFPCSIRNLLGSKPETPTFPEKI